MRRMKPTKRHRLALSPGFLGTVYGTNADGECRYFDYDMAAAREFAGVTADADPRNWPAEAYQYVRSGYLEGNPKPGERCVWVLR